MPSQFRLICSFSLGGRSGRIDRGHHWVLACRGSVLGWDTLGYQLDLQTPATT